jgi:plastocyanin
MFKRGTTGRRVGLLIALIACGAMVYAGIALAASDTIVAGPTEAYDHQPGNAPYNADQGEVVPFQDSAGSHNVTARAPGPDGKALFRTPTISGGTAGVDGTQYLSPGDYPFFCTVHPTTMSGTLHVTGNGTPQARPSAQLSVRSKKLAKVSKKGILVAITASAKVDGASLVAKLGKTTIGKLSGLSLAAGQSSATVKLTKAGKSKLSKKTKASVSVTADIPFGSPATAKSKLT